MEDAKDDLRETLFQRAIISDVLTSLFMKASRYGEASNTRQKFFVTSFRINVRALVTLASGVLVAKSATKAQRRQGTRRSFNGENT